MKTITTLLLTVAFFVNLSGQKFGKFDDQFLSKEYSSIDSAAHSEYITKKCEVSYEFNTGIYLNIRYFDRIKIYTEDGVDVANYEIPYTAKEEIYFIKAVSYNLESGERVEQKLKKKDIYKEKINEDYYKKVFAIPNVKKGTVIEVMYSIRTPYVYTIPKFYFQEDVPVVHAEYVLDLPKYIGLNPVTTGFLPLNRKEDASPSTYHGEKRYIYTIDNVPPIKEDKYVFNINDYRLGLKFEILSTAFPNSVVRYYSKDWNQIVTNLLERRSFGFQMKAKIKGIDDFIKAQQYKTEDAIITACYSYLIENYSWNEDVSIISEKGVVKTIKDKFGNSGDLNMLLVNLLNKCGVNCYPYLTRQRGYGVFTDYFPSLSNLNYMIACAEKEDGSLVFMDATNTELPLGQLPLRATNLGGIVVKDNAAIVYNMVNPNQYNSGSLINYEFDENNNKLIGTGQKVVGKYAAKLFKDKYEEKNKPNYEQELEDDEFVEIDGGDSEEENEDDITYVYEIEGLDDVKKDIKYKLKETNSESITKIDDKIFIESTLGYGLAENPFKEKTREYPIFYNYKVKIAQAINIKIPEGYEIESIPEDLIASIPSRKVIFRHSIVNLNESEIVINVSFQVKDPYISPEDYTSFKELFDMFQARSNEKIVLKRN